jgi:hypothetical protein
MMVRPITPCGGSHYSIFAITVQGIGAGGYALDFAVDSPAGKTGQILSHWFSHPGRLLWIEIRH